jgi:hypothetical protein
MRDVSTLPRSPRLNDARYLHDPGALGELGWLGRGAAWTAASHDALWSTLVVGGFWVMCGTFGGRRMLRVVGVAASALGPGQTVGADISRAFRAEKGGVPGKIAIISALALLGFGDFAMIQRLSRGSNLGPRAGGDEDPAAEGEERCSGIWWRLACSCSGRPSCG